MDATIRWLGAAGVECVCRGQTLLIDPYLTRFGFLHQWVGTVSPDGVRIAAAVPRCDHVLVTHAHWDHLMDVPWIVANRGAVACGSRNSCALMKLLGVAKDHMRTLSVGRRLRLGPFLVDVYRGVHPRAPGFGPGKLMPGLHPPLRARDYRMDEYHSVRVRFAGIGIMTDTGARPGKPAPTTVLFLSPRYTKEELEYILATTRPKVVIPYHWDSMYRPLSTPLRAMLRPPSLSFPPFGRMDPDRFARTVCTIDSRIRVCVLEPLRAYRVRKLVAAS